MSKIPRDVWLLLHDYAVPQPHLWWAAYRNGWTRRCPLCRRHKTLHHFPVPNGFRGAMWVCHECRQVKERTRRETAKLIRQGRLLRQPCEKCGNPAEDSQAHHIHYRNPRAVVFLCEFCHRELHHPKLPDRNTWNRRTFKHVYLTWLIDRGVSEVRAHRLLSKKMKAPERRLAHLIRVHRG